MASFLTFVLVIAMVVFSAARRSPREYSERDRVQGKQKARNFWCPTCQKTSQESCDAALANTTCPSADFCIALWEKQVFARKCVNRKMLEILTNGCRKVDFNTRECKRKKTYTVAWCNKTGCKAQVPKPIQREQTHARAFWCPTCHKTTQETCDAALTNTTCSKAELCMALWDNHIFVRKCVNKRMLELLTKGCDDVPNSKERVCKRKREYHVAWCHKSGCKAEVSKTSDDFWCPTCQNSSPESCDSTLTNITCPKADVCIAIQEKNVFARKCVNKQFLAMITKGCKNTGDKKRECNGKRQYHVTWCNKSGCRAEVSEIPTRKEKVPDDSSFECPTCPMYKSSTECDNSIKMTKCPRATRCLALRVNSTDDSESLFSRNCINKQAFELIQRACTKKQGCEMATCTQSGCKVEL